MVSPWREGSRLSTGLWIPSRCPTTEPITTSEGCLTKGELPKTNDAIGSAVVHFSFKATRWLVYCSTFKDGGKLFMTRWAFFKKVKSFILTFRPGTPTKVRFRFSLFYHHCCIVCNNSTCLLILMQQLLLYPTTKISISLSCGCR